LPGAHDFQAILLSSCRKLSRFARLSCNRSAAKFANFWTL